MGIFRKKLPKILDDPKLIELYEMLVQIKSMNSSLDNQMNKERALEIARACDKFDTVFQTELGENFMLRVNHADLASYKYIQSWIMDINGIKTHNLGTYIILWAQEHKDAKKKEVEAEFARITSGMRKSSYGGHAPNLHSALSYHNIDSTKLS